MLTPEKHLDLDTSVLRISAILLKDLQRKGVVEYAKLRRAVELRTGNDGTFAFIPALSLLFLLGLVDYHAKNDTVEYRGGLDEDQPRLFQPTGCVHADIVPPSR